METHTTPQTRHQAEIKKKNKKKHNPGQTPGFGRSRCDGAGSAAAPLTRAAVAEGTRGTCCGWKGGEPTLPLVSLAGSQPQKSAWGRAAARINPALARPRRWLLRSWGKVGSCQARIYCASFEPGFYLARRREIKRLSVIAA